MRMVAANPELSTSPSRRTGSNSNRTLVMVAPSHLRTRKPLRQLAGDKGEIIDIDQSVLNYICPGIESWLPLAFAESRAHNGEVGAINAGVAVDVARVYPAHNGTGGHRSCEGWDGRYVGKSKRE